MQKNWRVHPVLPNISYAEEIIVCQELMQFVVWFCANMSDEVSSVDSTICTKVSCKLKLMLAIFY